MFACCIGCHSGRVTNAANNGDTILLGKIITSERVGLSPVVLAVPVSAQEAAMYDGNRKTWLLLDDAQIITAPDGVYEIYVTGQPPQLNSLTAQNAAFVNVLDLYSITAPDAKQVIEVDIQPYIKNIFLQNRGLQTVYVTLLFSGNQAADGTKSKKAGLLQFSGIRLVQTKD